MKPMQILNITKNIASTLQIKEDTMRKLKAFQLIKISVYALCCHHLLNVADCVKKISKKFDSTIYRQVYKFMKFTDKKIETLCK